MSFFFHWLWSVIFTCNYITKKHRILDPQQRYVPKIALLPKKNWKSLAFIRLSSSQVITLALLTIHGDLFLFVCVVLAVLVVVVLQRHLLEACRHLVAVYFGKEFLASVFTSKCHHTLIHLHQVVLLRTQNTAWTRNSNPARIRRWWEPEVLHAI